jgi:hypothetical protein
VPALEEQLGLDVSPALSAVESIDAALTAVVDSFSANLAAALDVLSAPPDTITVPVDADTAQADAAIDATEDVAPVEIPVDADVGEAEGAIEGIHVEQLVLPVDADTGDAEAALEDIEGLADGIDIDIPVNVDTTGAQESISDLGQESESGAAGLGILQGAASGLTEELTSAANTSGAAGGALSSIGPAGIAAAGGIAIGTKAFSDFVDTGVEVLGITQQFADTFGDFQGVVEDVDVHGLNTDLKELALQLGVDDEAMLSAASRAGGLLQTFGATQEQAAEMTKEIAASAAVITSVNPAAGDLTDVMTRLTQAVATGRARGLKNLGLDVTPEEIEARANAMGKTTDALTATEKQAITLSIITDQLTGKFGDFGDEVSQRSKNAAVEMESAQERFKNLKEELSVQVALPVMESIAELAPMIEDLAPLARLAGQGIAGAFRIALVPIQATIAILGLSARALGEFIEMANKIPFVGRAIPDDVGDKLIAWGKGAESSAQNMNSATASAQGLTTAAGQAGAAGEAGAVGVDALGDAAAGTATSIPPATQALIDFTSASVSSWPTATAAVESYQSGAEAALKAVSDAAKNHGEGMAEAQAQVNAATNPQTFINNLEAQRVAMVNWRTSLATIAGAGFGDLLEQLIQAGPEQGALLAQQFAAGIASGQPQVAAAANQTIGAYQAEINNTARWIADTGAPAVADATGHAAGSATDAWESQLGFAEPAAEETKAAGAAISLNAPFGAAQAAGGKTSSGFTGGFNPVPGVSATMNGMQSTFGPGGVVPLYNAAYSGGYYVGGGFDTGFADGIRGGKWRVTDAASEVANAAKTAAANTLGAHSPSTVMYGLGLDAATGFANGLAAGQRMVAGASAGLASVVSPNARLGASGGSSTGGGNISIVTHVSGAVTPEMASAIGDRVGAGVARQLLRRDVVQQVRANA